MIIARELPVEEWGRLRNFGPFAAAGVLPNPDFAKVVVLEEDGIVVGSWLLTNIPLLEALYIDPDYRGNPTAAKLLFFKMMHTVSRTDAQSVLTVTQDPVVSEMAQRAGFQDLPGTLHVKLLKGGR